MRLALAAGVAVAATTATAQPPQKRTGPVAVYWMSAATQSGFGMPAMGGGGGRPSMGAMMGAMMGGGGATKSLTLQLGSNQATAQPAAEHLPPQGLGAGPSLPLVTPHVEPSKVEPQEERPEIPHEYQRPKGKMLIFWGCGQHARPGQPYVIDFSQMDPAKMKAGQIPPGLAMLRGFDYQHMQPPSPARFKTYGQWPNEKTRTQVPSNGSLVGEHTIQGNYSPTIKLNLDEEQDFLGPLNLTTNAKQPGGWASLGWNLVGNAQAYLATAIGGGNDTVVMWTSSDLQSAAFVMPDYLSNGEISRLVANKALMGPTTRTCDVPKEVMDAMPQGLVQMVAYGGEQNFAYPPRPQDPKVPWNIQWEVKVRYRSATGGLLGMAMPQMGGRGGSQGGQGQQPQQPPQRPSASDILKKGILGGALPFPH
jgi:hypothetical protein